MLRQRIVTGAIALPLLVIIVWLGEPWFTLLIALGVTLGSIEFYRMVIPDKKAQNFAYFGLPWSLLLVFSPHFGNTAIIIPILITSIVGLSSIWFLFLPRQRASLSNWAWTITGVFYIGWMLSYWVELRGLINGNYWVLITLLTTFGSDTSAFLVGKTWGKHPLAPRVSPGKTQEGTIGGVAGAIATSLIFSTIFPLHISLWQVLLLGFLISCFAQLGDLVESLLKRNAGVKDSGKLIPGHGGVLDRIDSIIFSGVVVYYYLIWVVG